MHNGNTRASTGSRVLKVSCGKFNYGKTVFYEFFIRWVENGADRAPPTSQASAAKTRGKKKKRGLSFLI